MRPLLTDWIIVDNLTPIEPQDINLGKEIAKGIAISFAIQAGSMAALLAVGYAYDKYLERKEAKKAKKNQSEN